MIAASFQYISEQGIYHTAFLYVGDTLDAPTIELIRNDSVLYKHVLMERGYIGESGIITIHLNTGLFTKEEEHYQETITSTRFKSITQELISKIKDDA